MEYLKMTKKKAVTKKGTVKKAVTKTTTGKKGDEHKFVLRMPEALHNKVVALAKKSGSSMNQEYVNIIEHAVTSGKGTVTGELASINEKLAKLVK